MREEFLVGQLHAPVQFFFADGRYRPFYLFIPSGYEAIGFACCRITVNGPSGWIWRVPGDAGQSQGKSVQDAVARRVMDQDYRMPGRCLVQLPAVRWPLLVEMEFIIIGGPYPLAFFSLSALLADARLNFRNVLDCCRRTVDAQQTDGE